MGLGKLAADLKTLPVGCLEIHFTQLKVTRIKVVKEAGLYGEIKNKANMKTCPSKHENKTKCN